MNRLPVHVCLEHQWQPTARRLLAPLTSAGRLLVPEVVRAQSRREVHQQSRSSPAARSAPSPPKLYPPRVQRRSLNHQASYATVTTPTPQPDPLIHSRFEPRTCTWQYVVADPSTNTAVIIDPVLDYDACSRTVGTASADALLRVVRDNEYTVSRILETHAHADHLTAAFYLQRRLAAEQGGQKPAVCVGRRIGQVQSLFGKRYGILSDEYDGVFDTLFEDDEVFELGTLKAQAIHLPGHTPDHMGYRIGDNVFCGDSLFDPSLGTARCDFPGGSAEALYWSGRMLLSLPDHVRIWTGHDYPDAAGRAAPRPWATVAEHRARNRHLRDGISAREFVEMRAARDSQLAAPRLVHESLQVNIRGGHLPRPDEGGMRAFKLPVTVGEGEKWLEG